MLKMLNFIATECLSSKIQYNHPMTFYFSFCNKNYITWVSAGVTLLP